MEWFIHTHKLQTPRDTVIFDCRKYFGLYLVLITVFAQLSMSLIILHVKGFFMWFAKLMLYLDLKLWGFFGFYDPFICPNPHCMIIMVHFLFPQKYMH